MRSTKKKFNLLCDSVESNLTDSAQSVMQIAIKTNINYARCQWVLQTLQVQQKAVKIKQQQKSRWIKAERDAMPSEYDPIIANKALTIILPVWQSSVELAHLMNTSTMKLNSTLKRHVDAGEIQMTTATFANQTRTPFYRKPNLAKIMKTGSMQSLVNWAMNNG